MEPIGKRIRKIRQNKGVSQTHICAKLGRSTSWLCNIESGYRSINTQELEAVAGVLDVDPAIFFTKELTGSSEPHQLTGTEGAE